MPLNDIHRFAKSSRKFRSGQPNLVLGDMLDAKLEIFQRSKIWTMFIKLFYHFTLLGRIMMIKSDINFCPYFNN